MSTEQLEFTAPGGGVTVQATVDVDTVSLENTQKEIDAILERMAKRDAADAQDQALLERLQDSLTRLVATFQARIQAWQSAPASISYTSRTRLRARVGWGGLGTLIGSGGLLLVLWLVGTFAVPVLAPPALPPTSEDAIRKIVREARADPDSHDHLWDALGRTHRSKFEKELDRK